MPSASVALRRGALAVMATTFAAVYWFVLPASAPAQVPQSTAMPDAPQPRGPLRPTRPGRRSDDGVHTQPSHSAPPGQISVPDKKAGRLIDTETESRQSFRDGRHFLYSCDLFGAILALLVALQLTGKCLGAGRGTSRDPIGHITAAARIGRWLLPSSLVILALSGFNLLFGRYVLMPLIGMETFALLTMVGTLAHNFVAIAFVSGLMIVFATSTSERHPGEEHPSRLMMLTGLFLTVTGLKMLFPFELPMFGLLTAAFDHLGIDTDHSARLTTNQELQSARWWHGIAALLLVAVVVARRALAAFDRLVAVPLGAAIPRSLRLTAGG